MDGQLPRISVVVAVRNGARTIEKLFESVLNQDYAKWELVVIDGGSTDGTIDVLKRHSARLAFWVSEPDGGIYEAWNKALCHATGDWVCFLGADDFIWKTTTFSEIVTSLVSVGPDVGIVYGRVGIVSTSGSLLETTGAPWATVKDRLAQIMCIPHPGVFYRRSLLQELGGFDPSFRIAGDYEFLLRAVRKTRVTFIGDVVVTGMQVGGISGHASALASLQEARRAQAVNGLPTGRVHWQLQYMKVKFRHLLWCTVGPHGAAVLLDLARRLVGRKPFWTQVD